jgi:hypothetical protein
VYAFLTSANATSRSKKADVTYDQSSNASFLREATDNVRRSMQRVVLNACWKSQMHNQNIRAFREIDELRVGSHLIRAEDDRHTPDLNAVGKRRHIAMRDSLRRYSKSVTVKDRRWFCFRRVDDADIESNAASGRERSAWYVAPPSPECGPEHWKRAILLVKQPLEERREVGHRSERIGRRPKLRDLDILQAAANAGRRCIHAAHREAGGAQLTCQQAAA